MSSALQYHDIANARIAARRSYPTAANWKLVMENFLECYHCIPSHPEYSSVMRHINMYGKHDPRAASAWCEEVESWLRLDAARAFPVSVTESFATEIERDHTVTREPVGAGHQTQSQTGAPVAPLMGQFARYDGGVTTFRIDPFTFVIAPNDHAVMFQFLPHQVELTHVVLTWLVAGSAQESEVEVDRMIWLWDVTTRQDKTIVETNAAGVRSRGHRPGPYTVLETWPSTFIAKYLDELSSA